jgi:WD40 repeat protein
LQVEGQKDLQTLLAYQAYLFNKKNGGLENDADIYNGLYNVARSYGNVNYKTFKHDGIRSIAFVPGKREFYTSGYDNKVLKWTLEGTNQTYQVIYSGTDIIEVLAVSPDASWLACGSSNSSIRMIPLKGNSVQYSLTGHTNSIKSLIFSFDGKYLFSAGLDGKVIKWEMATRTSTDVNSGAMKIISIDISSNGKYLAGLNPEGNVLLWDPESTSDNYRLPTDMKEIKSIRFNPDGNTLAIGDINGNIQIWDIAEREEITRVKAHTAQITDIQFNPVLKQMATASQDKTLKIYNNLADLTEPPITFKDNEGFIIVIKFSPDGQLIVSGAWAGAQNLVSRPTHVDNLAKDVCTLVSRNMNEEEWRVYVAADIPLQKTCESTDYNIKVNVVR